MQQDGSLGERAQCTGTACSRCGNLDSWCRWVHHWVIHYSLRHSKCPQDLLPFARPICQIDDLNVPIALKWRPTALTGKEANSTDRAVINWPSSRARARPSRRSLTPSVPFIDAASVAFATATGTSLRHASLFFLSLSHSPCRPI